MKIRSTHLRLCLPLPHAPNVPQHIYLMQSKNVHLCILNTKIDNYDDFVHYNHDLNVSHCYISNLTSNLVSMIAQSSHSPVKNTPKQSPAWSDFCEGGCDPVCLSSAPDTTICCVWQQICLSLPAAQVKRALAACKITFSLYQIMPKQYKNTCENV